MITKNPNLLRNVVLQALAIVVISLHMRKLVFILNSEWVLHTLLHVSVSQEMIASVAQHIAKRST